MANPEENCSCLSLTIAGIVLVVSFVIYYLMNTSKTSKKVLLTNSDEKHPLPLIEKEELSHDTKRFRLALPSKEHILGLPIGQHIQLSAKVNGELVVRPYTPVSSDDDNGFVDLVVKVYQKTSTFPNGGKMTLYLDSLKIGDTIDVRGPSGRIQYVNNGRFKITKTKKDPPQFLDAKTVSMIAGGVGITPILQLIRHITKHPNDQTKLSLIFANKHENDIFLREELEAVANKYPDRFKLWYTLDSPPNDWKYSTGFINETMIKEHLYPANSDGIVLMCGPPPMIKIACLPNFEKLNYDMDRCISY